VLVGFLLRSSFSALVLGQVATAAAIGLSGLVGYWSYLIDRVGEADTSLRLAASVSVGSRSRRPLSWGFALGVFRCSLWNEPNRPKSFEYEVIGTTGATVMRGRASGRQINTLSIGQPIAGIRLRGIPPEAEWPADETRFFK
jgi:hypothetical protein